MNLLQKKLPKINDEIAKNYIYIYIYFGFLFFTGAHESARHAKIKSARYVNLTTPSPFPTQFISLGASASERRPASQYAELFYPIMQSGPSSLRTGNGLVTKEILLSLSKTDQTVVWRSLLKPRLLGDAGGAEVIPGEYLLIGV